MVSIVPQTWISGQWVNSDSTHYYYSEVLGIESLNTPHSLNISPNPATTTINIAYNLTTRATLTLTDTYGRQVKHLTLYPNFKNRIVYVDDLPAGIYIVQLQSGEQVWVQKMVKE